MDRTIGDLAPEEAQAANLHGDDRKTMADAADAVVVVSLNGAEASSVQLMSPEDALHMVEACASPETIAALQSLFASRTSRSSNGADAAPKSEFGHGIRQSLQVFPTRPDGHRTRSRDFLSMRESQIVSMIGAGKTVGMIADELGLSVKTVSTYRTRALEKMGLKTNADLIRYVIEQSVAASAT